MLRKLLAMACFVLSIAGANYAHAAETGWARVIATCGTISPAYKAGDTFEVTMDVNGKLCTAAVTQLPSFSGTPTQSSVTVGTSSAQLIAASTFTIFAKVCVAQSATTGIWVNWSGAAAVQAAPSEYIPPGQCDSWVAATGYLPTSQVNAIASASVAATIIGK